MQPTVYAATLQHDESQSPATYAVKVITAEMLPLGTYRNIATELVNEYRTYYVLALGKNDGRFRDVIRRTTPACYGLYRARDELGRLQDIFVLVMEYAGEVNLTLWKELPMPEKYVNHLIYPTGYSNKYADTPLHNLSYTFTHLGYITVMLKKGISLPNTTMSLKMLRTSFSTSAVANGITVKIIMDVSSFGKPCGGFLAETHIL